jgi:hypothetical protein
LPYDAQNIDQKECLVLLNEPECRQFKSIDDNQLEDVHRTNHLGNDGRGEMPHYEWTLPYFASQNIQKCVFRIRYNISTDDYDPYNTDSRSNGRKYI